MTRDWRLTRGWRLTRDWIEAKQRGIGILQEIPGDDLASCTMDYPEDRYVVTR